MSRKALITGAAGFIGKHLAAMLLADGWDVTGYDLQERPHTLDCAWISANILDVQSLRKAMKSQDTVFHLAAYAHLYARDPGIYEQVNHQGTHHVLEAALATGTPHLIATSSAVALTPVRYRGVIDGQGPRPDVASLAGPYAQSKWRADALLDNDAATDLAITRLYPTVPVGPGDDAFTAPTQMIKMFLQSPPPAYLETALNLVPVDDIARAHLLAANRSDLKHDRRYVLPGERWTLTQILAFLQDQTGKRMPSRTIPYPVAYAAASLAERFGRALGKDVLATREGVRLTTSDPAFQYSTIEKDLGWTPGPVHQSLEQTLAWLQHNGHVTMSQ